MSGSERPTTSYRISRLNENHVVQQIASKYNMKHKVIFCLYKSSTMFRWHLPHSYFPTLQAILQCFASLLSCSKCFLNAVDSSGTPHDFSKSRKESTLHRCLSPSFRSCFCEIKCNLSKRHDKQLTALAGLQDEKK